MTQETGGFAALGLHPAVLSAITAVVVGVIAATA